MCVRCTCYYENAIRRRWWWGSSRDLLAAKHRRDPHTKYSERAGGGGCYRRPGFSAFGAKTRHRLPPPWHPPLLAYRLALNLQKLHVVGCKLRSIEKPRARMTLDNRFPQFNTKEDIHPSQIVFSTFGSCRILSSFIYSLTQPNTNRKSPSVQYTLSWQNYFDICVGTWNKVFNVIL